MGSIQEIGLDEAVNTLCVRIESLLARQKLCPKQRLLVALAGVPGSGKSTVSGALMRALMQRGIHSGVVVVPMDGFHYTKAALSAFDDPALAFRKRGAPFTFDAFGLIQLIKTLKTLPVTGKEGPESCVAVPSFDHAVQDPIPNDIQVSSRNRIVIIEGNYTLLDLEPWNEIARLVDEKWFVNVPEEIARARLVERHLAAGIETSKASAAIRAADNDIPNGDLIRAHLVEPDIEIMN
ncbi:phosphoribulokinase/uridine kinase [Truncatella angustata]|uniref:Phosphoribulokinase/uridine kinase n=1 Tax=Truncatella angustata TaxID=152316 RepID=A0A9P9A087_9PEZI|nr:phosphoribulokinase/uridine kinase [Truncatella angustata]KAH6655779.1 phosphoribulokinase/uridine kinase [Truncatella angustata]